MKALDWALSLLLVFCTSAAGQTISARSFIVTTLDGEVLLERNADDERPIASITKLFVAEQAQWLDPNELIEITRQDVLEGRMRTSPLVAGKSYTRAQLIELALIASDNVAAKALGRTMAITSDRARLVEASGLDPANQATARSLAAAAADLHSTALGFISVQPRTSFGRHNTNPLVDKEGWHFLLSKTGYIRQAGGCLVSVMEVKGQHLVFVILGSSSVRQRWFDLVELRRALGDDDFFVPREKIKASPKLKR